ncbi:hypothetical protein Turpa_3516 [Turneriella parva DSM 21527]|uniref:Activator of Hsp90 ATPase 1 family protein n=2 Tax=Turneriella TaxID=338321 RepID=I4BA46_TURPD|nr:hypothetical protein Turpa_3516 [Turneriella parva DSM 21527]
MQISQSEKNTPQLTITINAVIDAVWHALRHKEKLMQWHGWATPSLEDEINTIYFTDVKEETDDVQKYKLVVNGGDTFILKSDQDATNLTLVRAGLSGNIEWDAYYGNITEGWVSFIEQLRFLLEHSPKIPRKTTFNKKKLVREEIISQLNLSDLTEGTKFKGQLEGEMLSGEVWFNTLNQLGLVVNDWGPGLSIIQFSENCCIDTEFK